MLEKNYHQIYSTNGREDASSLLQGDQGDKGDKAGEKEKRAKARWPQETRNVSKEANGARPRQVGDVTVGVTGGVAGG